MFPAPGHDAWRSLARVKSKLMTMILFSFTDLRCEASTAVTISKNGDYGATPLQTA